jgi:hypothetical protein
LFTIDVELHKQLANSNWQLAKPFLPQRTRGTQRQESSESQLFEIAAFIRLAPLTERQLRIAGFSCYLPNANCSSQYPLPLSTSFRSGWPARKRFMLSTMRR